MPDAMPIYIHTVYCLHKSDTHGVKFSDNIQFDGSMILDIRKCEVGTKFDNPIKQVTM